MRRSRAPETSCGARRAAPTWRSVTAARSSCSSSRTTDLSGAIAVAERVRVATEGADDLPPFTISGGVALWDPIDGRDPQPLVRRADTALYLAKRAGRNRIVADELSIAMQRQAIASV